VKYPQQLLLQTPQLRKLYELLITCLSRRRAVFGKNGSSDYGFVEALFLFGLKGTLGESPGLLNDTVV
jgi:hypothetical protein